MKSLVAEKPDVKSEAQPLFKQKASLFNFVIYTHDKRRVPYFHSLAEAVIRKFPCRIIFIKGDTRNEEFETKKSLITVGPIACDHIEIHAGGSHLAQVPYYILPHLEPDLPIYLLWGQDPNSDSEILPLLVKYASRLIFDTECAEKLQSFSGKFLKNQGSFPCQVLDMNWARLAGWRRAIASALDSQERIEQLRGAKEVEIIFNSSKTDEIHHTETQADYLQAWLATRLGWKHKASKHEKEETHLDYTSEKNGVRIRIVPKEVKTFSPGSVISFFVKTYDQHEFRIERDSGHSGQVIVNISSKTRCLIPTTLPLTTQTKGSSYIRELLYAHPSHHYTEMLEIISNENLS